MNGARAVLDTLAAHDVEYVFGVCGDTSVGLYQAFAEEEHSLTHILARDERSAGYMADAYARLAGKPGVCEGPSGGGATYLLPGLAEANDSSIPVIGLNTDIPIRYRGRGVLTELDQAALFDPVTTWHTTLDHPDHIEPAIRTAFRRATTDRPGAVHVTLPLDILADSTSQPSQRESSHTHYPAYRPTPSIADVRAAANLLRDAAKPVIIVGGGIHASGASYELREFAEQTGIPVAQTLTAAGCLGDSPYAIGVVGENGGRADAEAIVTDADAHLLLGTAVESVWTHKWSLLPEDTPLIHADIDAASIGKNYHPTVSLVGDLRATITALAKELPASQKWRPATLTDRASDYQAARDPQFTAAAFPLHPERMVHDTRAVLPPESTIISDPGTSCPYFAAFYEFQTPGRHWVTPRAHGALGYAIPGVIGAKLACPDRTVVGFTGDGSVGTTAGELETLARLDLPVTIVVVNNAAFSWIEAGQRNYADFGWGVDFSDLNYAAIAEAFGLTGHRVTESNEYESALRTAITTDGPSVIDLPVQPLPSIDNPPVDWLTPED